MEKATLECLHCGFTDHVDDAIYCQNCSMSLDNNACSNPHCEINNFDEPTKLPRRACYCPYCGTESDYFLSGLISPTNLQPQNEQ